MFAKLLNELFHIKYSYGSIYAILTKAKIVSPERHRVPKKVSVHRPRYRREREGDMIQIDATPYQWFSWGGDNHCYTLHGAIDDATGKITGLYFCETECSYGYYDILQQTCERFGRPCDIYSDRSAIFCVSPKNKNELTVQEQLQGIHEKRTQWQRILGDLHINQILAWSPQAKGRIERLWRTLQGRLPVYFRYYKIKSIDEANKFLQTKYIEMFHKEFSIEREHASIWRSVPCNFHKVLCSKFMRKTNSQGTFSFQGYQFKVCVKVYANQNFELCIFKDGIKALIDNTYYDVKLEDEITDVLGERMSGALKNIITKYMYSDVKKICA